MMFLRCLHFPSRCSSEGKVIRQVLQRICQNHNKFSTYSLNPTKIESLKLKNGYQITLNHKDVNRLFGSRYQLRNLNYFTTQVSHFSTSSQRNEKKDEDNNKNNNKNNNKKENEDLLKLLQLGFLACILFDVLLFSMYAHLKEQDTTITWETFATKILPMGEVDKIFVSSANVAVVQLRHDAPYIPGERMRTDQKKPRQIILRGGFDSGVKLESLLRTEENRMNLDPNDRLPLMFNWAVVDKEMQSLSSSASIDMTFISLLLANTAIVAGYILMTIMSKGVVLPKKGPSGGSSIQDIIKNITSQMQGGERKMPSKIRSNVKPAGVKRKDEVKLDDVAGLTEAKQEVVEFVHFLKDPEIYTNLGAKMPRGCLLTGPPGCGKTLMARAIANESGVPFIAKAGSDFVEMIGGLGAKRIRDLFKEARDQAPCIIFIDEIDAVGASRENEGRSSSREKSQTLNQLLVEMDGMLSGKYKVIVLAATNRPDILDKALLRPGRFDRRVEIDLPTLQDRKDILEVHMSKIKLEHKPAAYSAKLAHMTPGMSGAELANLCNEAAIYAARNGDKVITYFHLNYAIDRVIAGSPKSSSSVAPEERKVVAVHESGHVLVGWLLRHTDALAKVTIVPRTGGALGFAQSSPSDRNLYSPEQIFDIMCMTLGGRAAENLVFNRITNGAQDDLKKVTAMADAQVKHFGFNSVVGEISFPQEQSKYQLRPFSDALAATIDRESRKLVTQAYEQTHEILKNNIPLLKKLADELYKRETLDYDDVIAILGAPPHGEKRKVEQLPLGPMATTADESSTAAAEGSAS